MKTFIKRKDNNTRLIVFFSGLGTDESMILNYIDDNSDLVFIYSYSGDLPFIIPGYKKYKEVILIGWALGIWAAEYFIPKLNIKPTASIAVNGTPFPFHDKYGIPIDEIDKFLETIDCDKVKHLQLAIFGGKDHLYHQMGRITEKQIEASLFEFRWMYNRIMEQDKASINWDYAIISKGSRIIPEHNMDNYWNGIKKTVKIKVDLPIFPFDNWKTISDFIEFVESRKEKKTSKPRNNK